MRKIFVFLIIFGLFSGSLASSQTFSTLGMGEKKPSIEEIAPEFEFIVPRKIKGKVEMRGKVKNANSVEFYYRLSGATSAIYLGNAQLVGENLWEYSWDTTLAPNGNYLLFAKITNQYGEYESSPVEIEILNEIPKEIEREKELKKEHQKIKEEIEEINKKIEEKKEMISQEISEKARKEEAEKAKEKIGELTEKIKEAEKIEKEIKDVEEKKKIQQEKVKGLEEEMKMIEKITEIKPEVKIIKEEKGSRLEIEKTKLQKAKEKFETLKEEKEKKGREKKEIKKEIIEKIKPEKKEEVSAKLESLEKEIKESQEIKIEKEKVLMKDSDLDGLSDEFEILIGTDPFNPDSDGDGFLDGIEYKLGYDPLKPGAADKIVYSDARKAKPQKTEIYSVESVSTIILPTGQMGIKIEGKGLPNSFVTIYIYSTPIVMVTKVDGNGNWSIVLDKPLADGTHEVYTTVTNNHGEITARSEPYIFEKSGERIVAITISGLLTPKAISPIEVYQKSFLILTLALIILAIGIAFIIIGISSQRRLKREKNNIYA